MRPLILITNDDGIFSPGLAAAAEAVQHMGDLLIAAPRYQQTGMGRSFPRSGDTGIVEKFIIDINGQPTEAFGIHCSPAFAVSYGVLELAPRKPDLCISGINYGENLGRLITCSGTIGAALEADSHDIKSIAVSCQAALSSVHSSDFARKDWTAAKKVTAELASSVLSKGLPGTVSILNVNIPDCAREGTETRLTRQSRSNYSIFCKPKARDFSKSFVLESALEQNIAAAEKYSDVYAVCVDRVISVTPLTWDLTADADWRP